MSTMGAVAVTPGTRDSLHVRNDVPVPRTNADEVMVRVLEAGVCGTDVEIHQGHYGEPPAGIPYLVLGHDSGPRVRSDLSLHVLGDGLRRALREVEKKLAALAKTPRRRRGMVRTT